jgi:hypothetical protein
MRSAEGFTLIEQERVVVRAAASVARRVNSVVPAVVADPEIVPVGALKDSPAGKEPTEIAQVTGASPPLKEGDDEYASPITAEGAGHAVITKPAPTVRSN